MPVTAETATVYRGARRRFLTLNGAVNEEAKAKIRAKYPATPFDPETGETFHWTGLPRSEVLLRRMCRLIRTAYEQSRLDQADNAAPIK